MSTMYDALKKAEAENKKAAGIEDKSTDAGVPTAVGGIPENIKVMGLLIAVIIVFTLAYYRFSVAKKDAVINKSVPVPAVGVPAGVSAFTPPKAQRPPGTYGLDGVIDAGVNSMAIINGKLLKVDETIDALVLKKISPKEVELLNTADNSTVILKID